MDPPIAAGPAGSRKTRPTARVPCVLVARVLAGEGRREKEREWETPERWPWSGGGGIGVSDGGVRE